MENESARMFLESLLDRVVTDSKTGKKTLPGSLSAHEISALKKALEILGGDPSDVTELSPPGVQKIKTSNSEPTLLDSLEKNEESEIKESIKSPPEPTIVANLKLTSLDYNKPEDENIVLCLDFGTAMSKAFAVFAEDKEVVENLPLKLGKHVSSSGQIYPMPSSLWIDNEGLIYLGDRALALSELEPSSERQRFDSIKKALIQGMLEADPDKVPVEKGINPTSVPFSNGDALTAYLAYLTDIACSELENTHSVSRYVYRRFALPSWEEGRRKWGEKMLATTLAKAQVLADTFHDRWEEGIPIQEIRSAIDQIKGLPNLPTYLIGSGVTEPLAAGTSRLRKEEQSRGLVVVVDVGAGTSDFAMFHVSEDPDRDIFRAWSIEGCNQSLHQAGDTLDTALQQVILEKAYIDPSHPDSSYIIPQLRMKMREFKEQLFREKTLNYYLSNGDRGIIELDNFLENPMVQRFSENLSKTFNEVLERADESFFRRFDGEELTVVFTGGGATLPMVESLAEGDCKIKGFVLDKEAADLVPEEFLGDEELSFVYPQLAVAIGGAQPNIIDESQSIVKMPGLAKQEWSLGRMQVTGVS